MQNEPDQALDFYVRAIRLMGERDSDVIRRTVQLLLPRRRIDEAGQLFDYLEKQNSPLLSEMNSEYLSYKVFRGDIAEAAKDVEKSVAADSKNYKDFLRQGEMYGFLARRLRFKAQSADRDPKADSEMIRIAQLAVNALLKARLLNPQADEVWIAIVQLLVDVGQPDKAWPQIAAAKATLKGEQAPLTLATCCELLNDMEQAQANYEAAAKAAPQSSRVLRQVASFYLRHVKFDLAEPILRHIVSLLTPTTLTDVCWARRSLADIIRSRGGFDHLCQGMALIDENLQSKAASVDDKRAKVHFLIADPRKEKLSEAIRAMEELVKGINATPEDFFALAQLYLKKGDWTSYENQMHSVLGTRKSACSPHTSSSTSPRSWRKSTSMTPTNGCDLEKVDKEKEQTMSKQERSKLAHNFFDTVRLRAEYQFLRGDYEHGLPQRPGHGLPRQSRRPAPGPRTTIAACGPGHGKFQRSAQGGR